MSIMYIDGFETDLNKIAHNVFDCLPGEDKIDFSFTEYTKTEENIIETITPSFIDERGVITNVLVGKDLTSVVHISSKAGSIRANHYHKTGSHWCYFLSGSALYIEQDTTEGSEIIIRRIKKGQMVYTGPMIKHAIVFLEDSEFLTLSYEDRNHDNYEEDLQRVEFI